MDVLVLPRIWLNEKDMRNINIETWVIVDIPTICIHVPRI